MRKGSKASKETRKKMSLAHKGHRPSIETRVKMRKSRLGKRHSPETIEKMRINQKGFENNSWIKNATNYFTIHKWIVRTYGKANYCEGLNCRKISNRFEWALIKGKNYARKRGNFFRLCKSCHCIYDNSVLNITK